MLRLIRRRRFPIINITGPPRTAGIIRRVILYNYIQYARLSVSRLKR